MSIQNPHSIAHHPPNITQHKAVPCISDTTHTSQYRPVNALFTTTAQIGDKTIHLLLDKGSQVNTISPALVQELQLHTKPLDKAHTLQFANSAIITVSHYIPCISLTIYGIHESNPRVPLYFNTGALVMESPQDMLIGIPFLTLLEYRITLL